MISKKIMIIGVALLMFSGVFGLIMYIPAPTLMSIDNNGSNVSPDLVSVAETASTSTSINYYTSVLQPSGPTQTVTLPVAENSSYTPIKINNGDAWTLHNTNHAVASIVYDASIPSYYYLNTGGLTLGLQDIAFSSGQIPASGYLYCYDIGQLWVNLSTGFAIYSKHYTINFQQATVLSTEFYAYNNIQFNITQNSSLIEYGAPITLVLTATTTGANFSTPPNGVVTSNTYTSNVISQTSPVIASVPYAIGYYFTTESSTIPFPSNLTSAYISTENNQYPTSATYNGLTENMPALAFTAVSGQNEITFTNTVDPALVGGVSGYTVQYYLSSPYEAEAKSCIATSSPAYTYKQVSGTTNQANASFSFLVSTPSGDIFSDFSGTLTTSFTPSITFSNPYSSYAQNEVTWSVTGTSSFSGSLSNHASITVVSSYHETASNTPSWAVVLNLYGNVVPTLTNNNANWIGKSDTAQYWLNATQPDTSGENLQLVINWGDGTSTTLTQSTYAFYATHNYASTGTYTISASLVNLPNPNTNGLSSLASSAIPSESYTITINPKPNPAPYAVLNQGQSIYMNYTAVNDIVNTVSLSINGIFAQSFSQNTASGSLKFSPPEAGLTAFTATWIFDGANFSYTITYSSAEYPLETSPYLTTMYGKNATKNYPLTINSPPNTYEYPISITTTSPNASQTYQQMITVKGSTYGINSQFSNIQFVYSNGTHIYAWIQSINTTSTNATIWLKLYSDVNQTIYLKVYPQSDNFLSATGYVGYGRTYFNAPLVFRFATDFQNLNGFTTVAGTPQFVSTGVNLTNTKIISNTSYLTSAYRFLWNASYITSSTSDYNYVGFVNGSGFNTPYLSTYQINYWLIQNKTVYSVHQFLTTIPSGNNTYSVWGNLTSSFYQFDSQSVYSFGTVDYLPFTEQFGVEYGGSVGTAIFHYLIIVSSPTSMPTISIGTGSVFNSGAHYQQLISLTNPQSYGINSASSNFYVALPNNTLLYTWIQSFNATSLTMWTKMPYSTSQIELQVLPSFENVLSATGYLGYGRTYFNAPDVFPFATDFTTLPTGWYGANYSILSNGISLNHNSTLNSTQNFSSVGNTWNTFFVSSPTFATAGEFYGIGLNA
ncbi:MAG: DUF2341 domain-containing protein, partial [Thermoplasmataceae archaeon]